MLHDQFGVVNDLLLRLGLISAPVAWTANPDTALWAVVMVDVWKTTPFMALLILAGLQMLPGDIYEAARVDGVHPVRVFFRITLPLIRPALLVAIIFRALDALRMFDLVYVLTANSPSDDVDVGLRATAARRLPGGRRRLGGLDADFPHHRAPDRVLSRRRARRHGVGGGAMRRALANLGFWLLVAVIAVFALFPFYYAVLTSFRSGTELFRVAYLPDRSICRTTSPSSSASLSAATF